MPVADWLAAHDVASLAPKFDEEGVETLEDLLAVVQAEGDLKYLGVDPAQAAQLWPAIQAVKQQEPSASPEPAPQPEPEPEQRAEEGVPPVDGEEERAAAAKAAAQAKADAFAAAAAAAAEVAVEAERAELARALTEDRAAAPQPEPEPEPQQPEPEPEPRQASSPPQTLLEDLSAVQANLSMPAPGAPTRLQPVGAAPPKRIIGSAVPKPKPPPTVIAMETLSIQVPPTCRRLFSTTSDRPSRALLIILLEHF